MKKIIFLILIFFTMNSSFAINEDVILLPEDAIESQRQLLEGEKEVVLEEEKVSPYTKRALKAIIEKEYNNYDTEGLLNKQLKAEFQKGIIKDAQFELNSIVTLKQNIEDNNSNLKANYQTMQLGLAGKFRSEKEGYNFLFELSPNIHDNFIQRFVADAWIQTKRIPNHTLMLGYSRAMVGYEGGQSQYNLPFLNRSQTARVIGNARKGGIRLKGDYKYVNYDIGGYSSDTFHREFFPGVETSAWVNFKPLANVSDKYGKLNIGGGVQAGNRNSYDFFTTTAAIKYDYKKFWMLAEYANADGSNGGAGLTTKKSQGYNLTLAYRLTKKAEVLLRYDDFDSDKKISNNNTKEYTAGFNYYVFGQALRFIFNYVFCQNDNRADSHKLIFGTQFLL